MKINPSLALLPITTMLMAQTGDIQPRSKLTSKNLEEDYNLIMIKESKLSANQRRAIVAKYRQLKKEENA